MRGQAHLAGGILVGVAAAAAFGAHGHEADAVVLTGAVSGVAPDFDILVYFAQKRSLRVDRDFHHHDWVSHTVPFYLLVLGLPLLAATWGGSHLWTLLLGTALLGCLVHLFQDLLWTNGVMLGWPFDRRLRAIFMTDANVVDQLANYKGSPPHRLEQLLVILASGALLGYGLGRLVGLV
jgi:membrane-bound metal-dependent hydrolase YbcI (DUF457 family)